MTMISTDVVARENDKRLTDLRQDYEHLGAQLARRGVDIDQVKKKVAAYAVAVPSWGVGTGGTHFARFPGEGEPILAMARLDSGGAIDPVATYRAAGYRTKVAGERPAVAGGGGII